MEQGHEPMPTNSWVEAIEAKIDPAHTLPPVEFVVSSRGEEFPSESRHILYDDQQVGLFILEFNHATQEAWIRRILIIVSRRSHGIALATYTKVIKEVLEKGYSFRTSPLTQTEEAKRIWELLAEAGVAQIEKEFMPSDQPSRYKGKYVVPAPAHD